MSDWRLHGQERFLEGVSLSKKKYLAYREGWDHDHCEFCGVKFSELEEDLNEGYVSADNYYWICEECFIDFRDRFHWKLVSDQGAEE